MLPRTQRAQLQCLSCSFATLNLTVSTTRLTKSMSFHEKPGEAKPDKVRIGCQRGPGVQPTAAQHGSQLPLPHFLILGLRFTDVSEATSCQGCDTGSGEGRNTGRRELERGRAAPQGRTRRGARPTTQPRTPRPAQPHHVPGGNNPAVARRGVCSGQEGVEGSPGCLHSCPEPPCQNLL